MGRSPGKWIKTVLFGKKSSKSSLSKNSTAEKKAAAAAKAVSGNLAVNCPASSDLPPQSTYIGREISERQYGTRVALPCDAVVSFPGMQGGDTEASAGLISANNAEITELEQAAIKAQAVFRGFLARRAFGALKGIIKLQALVRGHLVRRQAVATLRCLQAIVKFQALVRGRKVRLSDAGCEVLKKCNPGGPDAKVADLSGAWSEKLSTNAFVRKLRASLPTALPLSLQYDLVEPNSAWNWLERWSSSRFWEPVAQAKKIRGSKPQRKQADVQTTDTEPGKPKRGIRKVSAVNGENSSFHSTSEHEKAKRNPRKALSHQAELVQEQPQSELERVKRSLKKISVSTEEPSHKSEAVTEKKLPSFPVPDVSEQEKGDTLETISDPTVAVPKESMVETPPKPVDMTHDDQPSAEQYPLGNGGTIERSPIVDEDLSPKEDQTSKENERTRRRRSFPAKQEYPENVSQNTPTLPSYMAATESAKAKLRAQGSPRFGQDEVENGFTRRHSLPSNTNGKLSSQSPRMPKPIQTNGKGGFRSDRSLLSSRDGWKR